MSSVRRPNSRPKTISTYGIGASNRDVNRHGKTVKKVTPKNVSTVDGSVLKVVDIDGSLQETGRDSKNKEELENRRRGKKLDQKNEGGNKIGGGVRTTRVHKTPKSTTNSRARRSEQRKIDSNKNSKDNEKLNQIIDNEIIKN